MATWNQWRFQDRNSPTIECFTYFHDFANTVLVGILGLVGYALVARLLRSEIHKGLLEGQAVEAVWTILPAGVLALLAIPSLTILYTLDEALCGAVTLKAIGHQWYWSYEYRDFPGCAERLRFDSYMLPAREGLRLLETDAHCVVPREHLTRVLVRSSDVLHAWALPGLGVKADACPGRLNRVDFAPVRPGLYYGQCSEICGANHRFMPITVEVTRECSYISWAASREEDLGN